MRPKPSTRLLFARAVSATALLLLALPNAAGEVYSSSNRVRMGVGGWSEPDAVMWYFGPPCGPYTQDPWDGTYGTWKGSARTLQEACTAEAQTVLQQLNSTSPDRTKCFTSSATIGSWTCPAGSGACREVDEFSTASCTISVCTVKGFESARAKEVSYPAFVVQNLNYALPGNTSFVSYTNESSRGATWSTETSTGVKANVSISNDLIGFSGDVGFSITNSTKTSAKSSASSSSVFPSYTNAANYLNDEFVLWINPTITRFYGCGKPEEYVYGASGTNRDYMPPYLSSAQPIIERFTVGEIVNPAALPDGWRKKFLLHIAPAERFSKLLSLDPRIRPDGTANPNPVIDLNRYRPVMSGTQLSCPTSFTGVRLRAPLKCSLTYDYSRDRTTTFNANFEARQTAKMLVSSGMEVSFSYSRTYTEQNSTSNSASLELSTDTSGVCILGQIYMDTMFNTYFVNSTTYSSDLCTPQ